MIRIDQPLVIEDSSDVEQSQDLIQRTGFTEGAAEFLDRIGCASFLHGLLHDGWEQQVETLSPQLAPFLIKAHREKLNTDNPGVVLKLPRRSLEARGSYAADAFPDLLRAIGASIGMVVAAGGAKSLIELLKAWVEERKGRRIKIRCGDTEVEIQGGVSSKDVSKAVSLLQQFASNRSKIIVP